MDPSPHVGDWTRPIVPTALATPRLRLDPLRVEDADAMTGVLADPALYAFTGGEPPTPEALRRQYAAQVMGSSPNGDERWLNWIVRLAPGDAADHRAEPGPAIGFVQATVVDAGRRADIAWVIGVASQGRGYATEAAIALTAFLLEAGVATLTAHVHPDHAASAAVAARAGLAATGEIEDGEQVWRFVADSRHTQGDMRP